MQCRWSLKADTPGENKMSSDYTAVFYSILCSASRSWKLPRWEETRGKVITEHSLYLFWRHQHILQVYHNDRHTRGQETGWLLLRLPPVPLIINKDTSLTQSESERVNQGMNERANKHNSFTAQAILPCYPYPPPNPTGVRFQRISSLRGGQCCCKPRRLVNQWQVPVV